MPLEETLGKQRVLITGTTGFVGEALLRRILEERYRVVTLNRKAPTSGLIGIEEHTFDSLLTQEICQRHLRDCETVVHCAARVHILGDHSEDPIQEFRIANVELTKRLADRASKAGAKRFIFLSSIKVNGESTQPDRPFTAEDSPNPIDPYGISKMEAEEGLKQISAESGMEYTIIRPVLVYGPGVKANFAHLIRLVAKGLPLPLGSSNNKRSLVALDNLVDLITTCIDHPAAANQTFLVSDDNDLSTAELIREIARCQGKSPRLLPFPPILLKLAAKALGKGAVADRLLGSLQVEISHTFNTLGWRPPVSTAVTLQKTVDSFCRH